MNARLYDPVLHTFLSPDALISDPSDPQHYNRYAYCLNNPLLYVDYTGNVIDPVTASIITAAIIGAIIGGVTYVGINLYNGTAITWGGLAKSIIVGAVSGAATAGIGHVAQSATTTIFGTVKGTIENGILLAVTKGVMHGAAQGIIQGVSGGNAEQSFITAMATSIAGDAFGAIGGKVGELTDTVVGHSLFGAVTGGVVSNMQGGNFWEGATIGLTVGLLNHAGKKLYPAIDGWLNPKPKFRWRHLFGPDAVYVAVTEDLGLGLGVGFEQGALIILKGPDAGIYPAYDFGVGLHTASGSVAVEAVSLYYSGETVTKDVFYGNRYEFNIGADALGHVGLTAVYAPLPGGNMVYGSGISLGVGFSATVISGSLNYGRTQSSGNNMIPNLIRNK